MDKILELLKLFEKFGVKPGKIIGAGDRKVTPIKRPILSKPLNRDYLLEDVEEGKIGINTVKNEIEDVAPLFFQKQLNDVEINNLISNLNYLDNLLNPTNIVDIKTKEAVKGLESLRPTSITGGLEKAGKQLKEVGKKLEETTKPNLGEVMKDFAQTQRAMQDENKIGYVRATVREIMREDIKAGILKLPKELEDQIMQGLGEPIDVWRRVYGEGALEQIDSIADDIGKLRTEMDAAKLARSKFKFEPDVNRLPGSVSIEEAKKAEQEFGINKPAKVSEFKAEATKRTSIDDLIDEYNANQDRLLLTDDEGGTLITYPEYNRLKDRNEEIAKALENKGISSKIEEEVKPEGIVIPFKKKLTEPEEKADGGIIRSKFASGGKGKKILDIITDVNKKLKGKKSMETVNPKTGEITVADEFVVTADKKRQLTKEEIEDYEEAIGRNSEEWLSKGTLEEAEEALKRSKGEEAYYRGQYLTGKLDPAPGEQTQGRMNFLRKKAEYAEDVKDRRLFTLDEMNELDELEKIFELRSSSSINISDPKVVEDFTNFARENDPEGFKKIQKIVDDINNKNALKEFNIKDREPNASGGLNYLMGF